MHTVLVDVFDFKSDHIKYFVNIYHVVYVSLMYNCNDSGGRSKISC